MDRKTESSLSFSKKESKVGFIVRKDTKVKFRNIRHRKQKGFWTKEHYYCSRNTTKNPKQIKINDVNHQVLKTSNLDF